MRCGVPSSLSCWRWSTARAGHSRSGRGTAESNPCRRSGAKPAQCRHRTGASHRRRDVRAIGTGPIRCLREESDKAEANVPAKTARQPCPVAGGRRLKSITFMIGCSTPSPMKCRSSVTHWLRTRTDCSTSCGPSWKHRRRARNRNGCERRRRWRSTTRRARSGRPFKRP